MHAHSALFSTQCTDVVAVTYRRCCQQPCLVVLLVLAVLVFQPISAQQTGAAPPSTAVSSEGGPSSSGSTGPPRSHRANWVLQRVQQVQQPSQPANGSGTAADDADESADFASTANDLAEQAVSQGTARAALLEQEAFLDAVPSNASSTDNSTSAELAALQELQLQHANDSSATAPSSGGVEPTAALQLVLRTVKQQWEASRNRQQQQQQDSSAGVSAPKDAGEQWVAGLDAMTAKYPSLSGFARLARNNSALVVSSPSAH